MPCPFEPDVGMRNQITRLSENHRCLRPNLRTSFLHLALSQVPVSYPSSTRDLVGVLFFLWYCCQVLFSPGVLSPRLAMNTLLFLYCLPRRLEVLLSSFLRAFLLINIETRSALQTWKESLTLLIVILVFTDS